MAKKNPPSWSDEKDRKQKDATHLAAMENAESNGNGAAAKDKTKIVLPLMDIRPIQVKVVGESSLICHRWSEKAMATLIGRQTGEATAGREKKNPEQDYLGSLYPHPDGGYGFPTIAFKKAMVAACTSLGRSITKVQARQAFHIMGELVKIEGKPNRRQDMVRVDNDKADVRYRGEFKEWSCTLTIRYNARVLSAEQIINLLNIAGFGVGVGEWRIEKDGNHGMFRVA